MKVNTGRKLLTLLFAFALCLSGATAPRAWAAEKLSGTAQKKLLIMARTVITANQISPREADSFSAAKALDVSLMESSLLQYASSHAEYASTLGNTAVVVKRRESGEGLYFRFTATQAKKVLTSLYGTKYQSTILRTVKTYQTANGYDVTDYDGFPVAVKLTKYSVAKNGTVTATYTSAVGEIADERRDTGTYTFTFAQSSASMFGYTVAAFVKK